MAGKPQRDEPKQSIQMRVETGVYVSVLPLLNNGRASFSSMSQLVETIIFLSEHMYVEEPDDDFVIRLANLKAQRAIERIRARDVGITMVHVTLDSRAVSFMDMLVYRYGMVFRSRNELLELLLHNVGMACNTPNGIRYYGERLLAVRELHPLRRMQAPL